MKRIYRIARPVSLVLAVYVFMISGPHQAALAALVGTENIMDAAHVQNARDRVRDLMAREDVQAALVGQGIDPAEARARAEALSDSEALRLAEAIDLFPGCSVSTNAMLLDETIGRAIRSKVGEEVWGVTMEFSVKYRKPIPLEGPLRVVGRISHAGSRLFEGTGEILLPNGDIAATGAGKYLRLPIDKIGEFDPEIDGKPVQACGILGKRIALLRRCHARVG